MVDQLTSQLNVPVSMIRDDLNDIPQYDLPVDYSFEWYLKGYEKYWTVIQKATDKFNDITDKLFYDEFGDNSRLLFQRQCYVFYKNQTVGTATAWFNNNYKGMPFGRLHWVAIEPTHQGLGISKPLLTTVCEKMRRLGHKRVYLTTSSIRIPAINLYLKFGFQPEITNQGDLGIWLSIQEKLKYPLNLVQLF